MATEANRSSSPEQLGPRGHDPSLDALSYQKPEPIPGWDQSLWPKSRRERRILFARLTSWHELTSVLLTSLCVTVVSLFFASQELATLHLIELPAGWHVITSSWRLHSGAFVFCFHSILFGSVTILFAVGMIRKWVLSPPATPDTPDPDYRRISFRFGHRNARPH